MTQVPTDTTQSARTQHLPTIAPEVRTPGNSGADAFGDLFAEKLTPPVEAPGNAEPTDESAEHTDPSAESEESESEPQDESDDGQKNNADRPIDGQPNAEPDADADPDQNNRPTERPIETGQTEGGGVDAPVAENVSGEPITDPTAGVQTNPEAAAAVAQSGAITDQAQIRQELKNAAVVDLSSIARGEMLGRVEGSRPTPPATDNAAPKTEAPAPPPPTTPAGNDAASGRGGLERTGLPTPSQTPPPTDSDSQQNAAPGGIPFGKNPNPGGHPLSAPGAARTAGDPPPDAKQQTAEHVSKVAILDRLVNRSAARRGAVAAVDRIHQAAEPVPAGARRAMVKHAEAPKPARDVFMSPVQRGLGKMLAEGGGKMTVMLRPRELGDVKIAMETERGAVRVKMEASTDAARKTLEAGLESLRGALESKGVRVESMEVHHAPTSDSASTGTDRETGDPGRSDQRHPSEQRRDAERERAEGDQQLGDEPGGIWTELGIDAVA